MADSECAATLLVALTAEARSLLWVDWGDAYIVYQPSSTETHVFNETTATVLRCLENGPLTMEALTGRMAEVLGLEPAALEAGHMAFATGRLEALGLVECSDEAVAVP